MALRAGSLTIAQRLFRTASVPHGRCARVFSSVADESHDDFKPIRHETKGGALDTHARIEQDVKDNRIVLYMKGLPSSPQCGFSYRTVLILNSLGVQYRAFNVLSSPELRDGIKTFSSWPTIPQMYIDGEFVGGCDIVEGMFSSGELQKLLADKHLLPKGDGQQTGGMTQPN
eukprot:CAMPEP_0198336464 /NCGR_PEP_ID=MMETSP1450-20131203/21006_1 /TAXON_ID=753684 ORGANISM="Madagascaria erythrocladiodes, Strain CCMP3234" /NCGR_SAMPLE_ID=MMETSP1450 /ASSEMBLY_ACC=CAM_ASM_001115 /LENGTH=171 /DNA_ID=CAMNT_0044041203 /DNA_START=9 /DNA_END=524 /DNA_ORIENTATION=-